MDYHSSIADDEHPVGASPWGSSPPASPRRNESTFNSLGNEQPPYPYPTQDSNNGFAQEDPGLNAFKRPGTASSTASTKAYDSAEQSEPSQPHDAGAEAEEQLPGTPQQQSQTHDNSPGTGPSPEREQQPQRPRGPHYKLQAKITGLERTGRKDPILRFDVHVGLNWKTDLCVRYLHS